ncbi:MAG TPA: hypothetical protein VG826_33125 [Pirellulales bacterium]|nr:hypothetical protein [Pirellulales bacterium]
MRGAADGRGPFADPSLDAIIGAEVCSSGDYPAKLVDLDPDNQQVSQIWGLEIEVRIPDPKDASQTLASVTGVMPPTAFGDLWSRATNAPRPGMPTMSAAFQAVLINVKWANPGASPLLAALQQVSPTSLSIRFVVDSYQPSAKQSNFTYGRVVGTIGPALSGDAPRSTPRRLAPVYSTPAGNGAYLSILSTYGPAGALWDAGRKRLVLDLGNCVPTVWSLPGAGPSVPVAGWPAVTCSLQLSCGTEVIGWLSPLEMKSGAGPLSTGASAALHGHIAFDTATYLTYAGIVETAVPDSQISLVLRSPLTLTNVDAGQIAVQEDPAGRYVDVDQPFLRLNPGDSADVTLRATKLGQPWAGVTLPVDLQPVAPAANGGPWNNNDPPAALMLSAAAVVTGADGTATLKLTAGDPGTPRLYRDGQAGPDGQIYAVTSLRPIPGQPPQLAPVLWPSVGQVFLFPGAPINVLVFSRFAMPAQPNWDDHVGPILSLYARLYPYMKGIIDLADYATVTQNAEDIQAVLNLPVESPHYMPIVRDLSADKLAMINRWFENGMPKSRAASHVIT